LRPSGRCRQLRFASSSSRPERLHSCLQGRPHPGPLHQTSSRSVATRRTVFKSGAFTRPAHAPLHERRTFSSGTSPPENPFIRSTSRAVFATLTSVRSTLPRPRRGQASRQVSFFRFATERDLFTLPARRRPVGSGLPPHFVQFQTGPSLNRRGRYAFASHVAAPLRGQACGAVAPQPSRHRRITPSSVPSGVPLCGLPFRESPATPVSPSGLRPFTLSPQSRHGSSFVPQRGVAAHRRSFRADPLPAPRATRQAGVVAFGSSGRHAVAWRSINGKRCFPFRRSPVPGEGSGEKKNSLRIGEASNAWKSGPEIFQRLEKRLRKLPMFGKTAWRPFRSSEKGEEGVPRNRG